jgi:hypothetical protein
MDQTLAIVAAVSSTPVKPKMPATMAINKNISAHLSIASTSACVQS